MLSVQGAAAMRFGCLQCCAASHCTSRCHGECLPIPLPVGKKVIYPHPRQVSRGEFLPINNYHEHLPHGIRLCPTSSLVCSPPQTEPRGQHHELALHHAVKNPLVTAAGRPLSLSDGRIWFRRSFLHAESTTRQCVSPAHTHTIDLNVVALLGPWVPVCGCFYRRPAAPWTRCGASCSAAMHQLRSCLALAGLPPAGASRTSPSTATASS